MLPIFKEYKQMIESFDIDLSMYDDEKLWVDNLIVKGFDKKGKEVKILKLKISDDLEYSAKYYYKTRTKKGEKFKELIMPKNEDLITWNDLYAIHETEIRERERESLDVIKKYADKYKDCQMIVSTSMGKDSKLTEHLVSKIINNYRIIFNNTTCDSASVYKEVKGRPEIEIVTPKDKNGKNLSLYKMVKTRELPRRAYRWCCSTFKEGSIKQHLKGEKNIVQFLGMRNEESATRKDYQFEKEDDRFDKTWHLILPIRKWTELELWLYTLKYNIPINEKYKEGYNRVGCHIICPFPTKSTWILDKYYYPNQYKRLHKIIEDEFISDEKWCINKCTLKEYHKTWNGNPMREFPNDETIEEFMKYKGIESKELALQYFNKQCFICGKNVYHKDVVAMNLKYFGRNINKFKCKKCLMKEFNWTKEDWDKQVKTFKQQDCKLF